MNFCPNLSNKKIKQEFEELVDVLGENSAYYIWDKSNGNGLELAPNGASSKLFKDLLKLNNGDRKAAIIAKAKTYSLNFFDWFGDWTSEDKSNVSKVVDENGEPLIVYHGSKSEFEEFNTDSVYTTDYREQASTYGAEWEYVDEVGLIKSKEGLIYDCFINIKNPNVVDAKNANWNKIQYDGNIVTTREIENDSKNKGYDGVIIKNVFDNVNSTSRDIAYKPTTVYTSFDPNQVKSATDNNGNFSTKDNNIYHNMNVDGSVNDFMYIILSEMPLYKYLAGDSESKKLSKNSINIYKNTWWFNVDAYNKLDEPLDVQIERWLESNNYPKDLLKIRGRIVELNEKALDDQITPNKFKGTPEDIRAYQDIINFLSNKYGIMHRTVTEGEAKAILGTSVGIRKTNAFYKDGMVYFIEGRKLTADIASEEFLHPIVDAISKENPELFNNLLSECEKLNPKLRMLIKNTYNSNDYAYELITQSLARAFAEERKNNPEGNKFKDLINMFIQALKDIFTNGLFNIKNREVKLSEINKDITVRDLAKIINSNDFKLSFCKLNTTRRNMSTGDVKDILDNNKYEEIRTQLLQEGIDDDGYAMRTAIHITRKEYMDSEEAKYIQQYILDLSKKPNGFFKKVLYFFKSKWNKGQIKDPSLKNRNNARDRAKKEFDETIYHNTIMSIIDKLRTISNNLNLSNGLADYIYELYNDNNRIKINTILSFTDIVANRTPIIFNSKEDVYRVLLVLEDLNSLVYTNGIDLFESKENIAKYIFEKDLSKLSLDQQDYIHSLANNSFLFFDNFINDQGILHDLRTMFFEFEDSLRCPNEQAYDAIKSGLESRLMSIKRGTMSNSKNVIYNIKSRISKLKQMNMYSVADMYKVYLNFLEQADIELDSAINFFDKCILKGDVVDAETLMYFKKDVLGYYSYIINNYIKTLSQEEGLSDQQRQDIKDLFKNSILDKLNKANNLFRTANEIYVEKVTNDYVDQHVELGNIEAFKRRVKAAIANKINNGALGIGENFFGDANSSQSNIVRMMANMLNNDDREVHRRTYSRGKKLMKLYNECESTFANFLHPENYMKNFVELDNSGRPTGNFIRDINYGLFENNKKEYEAKLRKTFRLTVDENGNTVFHWEDPNTESIYNKYQDALDDWLQDNCNRRYTADYYKTRRKYLTYEVRQVLNPINELILLLQDKCTVDGFVYVNLLSLNERLLLQNLQKQKQEISNPYLVEYDVNGNITSLKKKTGDELRIAELIQAWNRVRSQFIKSTNKLDKYNEALAKITDPNQRTIFEQANTKTVVNPKFYDLLSLCSTATQTEEYLKISSKRSKLLQLTREDGEYIPNLLRLNDEAWDELHDLEEELENKKTHGSKGSIEFDDIAVKLLIRIQDPIHPQATITILDYIKRQYQQKMLTDPNAMNEYYNRFYLKVYDKKNKRDILRPLNVFYETKPKNISYTAKVTTGSYVEYDKNSSPWMNIDFDDKSTEQYQPLYSKYKNELYDKIINNPKTKAFYEDLIKMMDEAILLLPSDVKANKYKMPQITDGGMSLMARSLITLNWRNTFKPMSQYFTLTENDVDFNENRALRPDGSVVESIPMRFIRDLDDKSNISCDILHTVSLFYLMALNYSLKSKTVPMIESIIDEMSKDNSTDQVKRAKTELEMYGYGRMLKGIGEEGKKMSKFDKFVTKMINNHRHLAQLALLSGNVASATKGAIAAQWQVFWGGVIGKYYGKRDLLFAYKKVFTGLPNALRDLGSNKTHNLLQALMLKDGAARSISDIFKDKHQNILRRLLGFFKMGLFTIGDYTSNAMITAAVYHATRLVEDPINPDTYKFMTKTQLIDAYRKSGKSVKLAKKSFRRAEGNNLFNMWELDKDGIAVLKKEVTVTINGKNIKINPSDYLRPDGKTNIEDRIAGTIESRASVANGVTAEHGKGAVYQNTYAKLVMVMRGFLISQGYDRLKGGNDFEDIYYDNGQLRSSDNVSEYHGQYNFETGEVERGTLLSTDSYIKSLFNIVDRLHDLSLAIPGLRLLIKDKLKRGTLTREDIMGVKQTLGDIIGATCFLSLCAFVFIPASRRYPDSWFLALMRLVTAGVGIETATMLNPNTGLDLLTSVTTVKSWIDDYLSIFGAIKNVIFSPEKLSEPVSSGPYYNKPRWFRYLMKSLLKPTGITGYYESFAPTIPGLDEKETSYTQDQQKRLSDIENRPWFLSKENFGNNLYDMYKVSTTPYGMDSKYDYYQKKVSPATWLPKRKEETGKTENNSSSRNFGRSSGRSGSGRKNGRD